MIKLLYLNTKLNSLIAIILLCISIQAIGQKEVFDTTRWHPKEFHIIYPDMKLTFKLPYEKDQSGVRNLLFQCKETGKIHLLDTIKTILPNRFNKQISYERYWNSALIIGSYDAIVLYNNGTYAKYNDIVFKEHNGKEIDMTKSIIQLSDLESKRWLDMRAFFTDIDSQRETNLGFERYSKISGLGIKIRGYIFRESGISGALPAIFKGVEISDSTFLTCGEIDGYFEIGLSDASHLILTINTLLYFPFEINVTVDCGLFIVQKETLEAKEIRYYGSNH